MIVVQPVVARSIANLLVENGVLEDTTVSRTSVASSESGRNLLATLVEFGHVTEDQITDVIGQFYGLKKVSFKSKDEINPEALAELPDTFITKNRILPFDVDDNLLKVAVANPANLAMMGNVRVITEKKIEPHVTGFSELQNLFAELFNLGTETEELQVAEIQQHKNKPAPAVKRTAVKKLPKAKKKPGEDEASSEVIIFVNSMFREAVERGASDIHIEAFKDHARMRFRIDGMLQAIEEKEKYLFEHYSAIATRIKIMSLLDIAERRLPQDGSIIIDVGGNEVDIRVSSLPTSFGERIVMRILDRGALKLTLDSLGFDSKDLVNFKQAVDSPQGMILVTGPTGSGKSTTLYAVLGRLNREEVNILTAEDPVEYSIDGVGQVQIKEAIGLTFAAALRSFLRQDPEIILVGEIRDTETADIAIKAALTGHLVLSTLHTNDAISSVTRLLNMGIPDYLIAGSLRMAVAQRLVRKNCKSCNVIDDTVTPDLLVSFGFSPGEASRTSLYRGKGCPDCNGTGFKGRQGVYEVLPISDSIRQAILQGKGESQFRELAIEEGFSSMQTASREMMLQGVISADEYRRVLM
ncbi:MAG TPA: GspE/PulE family protein [Desulfobacterales bacterium]|nr:GspE/PulE family protein [Desulfobacterales bacterium]